MVGVCPPNDILTKRVWKDEVELQTRSGTFTDSSSLRISELGVGRKLPGKKIRTPPKAGAHRLLVSRKPVRVLGLAAKEWSEYSNRPLRVDHFISVVSAYILL